MALHSRIDDNIKKLEERMATIETILAGLYPNLDGPLQSATPEWPPTTGPLTHIKSIEVPVGPFKAGKPAMYQFERVEWPLQHVKSPATPLA